LKNKIFAAFIFFLGLGMVNAQTAEQMDIILETSRVTYAMASYAVLPSAGIIDGETTPDEAFKEALSRGFLPKKARADGQITLGDLSFLIMKSFNMKSGLMYALFPGPRYAFRELSYRKLIQGRLDPALRVSGDRLLRIVSRVLEYQFDTLVAAK
jgi:hypothetical protein